MKFRDGPVAITALIIFSGWLFVGLPWLTTPLERIQYYENTQAAPQPSTKNPNGSAQSPFFVRVAPLSKSAKERTQEVQEHQEKIDSGRWLVRWTFGLFVATVGLILATLGLYVAGERQLKHLKTSTELQLRAYIHIVDVKLDEVDESEQYAPNFIVKFKNYGATPAYEVRNRFRLTLATSRAATFDDVDAVETRSFDLGPSQERTSSQLIHNELWHSLFKTAVLRRAGEFILYGEITYFDAFQDRLTDKPRATKYRLRLDADDEGIVGFTLADEGNESN